MPHPKGSVAAEIIAAQPGYTLADYSGATVGGLIAILDATRYGFGNTGWAAGDTYRGITGLIGSSFGDLLIGDDGRNALEGGAGDDSIIGGLGADTMNGGEGRDTVSYAFGVGPVHANIAYVDEAGADAQGDVFGSIENLIGSAFEDVLGGSEEKTNSSEGNNVLDGGAGNDRLAGYGGADTLIGGSGIDFADYSQNKRFHKEGFVINLTSPWVNTHDAAGDAYLEIEGVIGTEHNDRITGNGSDNILDGFEGVDSLAGSNGNDAYRIDNLGDRVIESLGEGIDLVETTVSYRLGDNVENLTALPGMGSLTLTGNGLDNAIVGNEGSNALSGEGGRDVLDGGAGSDRLSGGAGNDVLTGGVGRDSFLFNTKIGTWKTDRKVNFDTITDFSVRDDSLWLDNAMFRKLGSGTPSKPKVLNKEFFTAGSASREKDDYLVYNKKTGVLSYDADGSGRGKAVEIAKLSKNLKLAAHDFFVI